MKLGMEVGLGPGHTVLEGDPAPKNAAQHTFWPIYCGQMAGWIKMPLGTEVSLSPGHIVLNGDPLPPHRGKAAPSIFGPCLLWPNGWMDQDATWYIGRPSFPPKKGIAAPFLAHVYCGKRSPISATVDVLCYLFFCSRFRVLH